MRIRLNSQHTRKYVAMVALITTDDDSRKMATNFDKFRLLMWKNCLIQLRHPIQSALEVGIPILFSFVLIGLRSCGIPEEISNDTTFKPFDINTLTPLRERYQHAPYILKEWKLVYSPQNPELENLVVEAAKSISLGGVIGVDSSEELVDVMLKQKLFAGIEFNHPPNLSQLPNDLSYTLRFPSESRIPTVRDDPLTFNWFTNRLYSAYSSGGPREKTENHGGQPYYFEEGFIPLQDAIARSFMEIKCKKIRNCGNSTLPTIQMQRYPYPPYILDVLVQAMETVVSFLIVLSFIYPCMNTVRFVGIEKERQLKETMKIMGLPTWLHWTTWFVRTMLFMTVTISIMVVLVKTKWSDTTVAVFTHSHWSTLWIYLFFFSISMTTYCLMCSTMFSKANTAAAMAGFLWFFLIVPFSITNVTLVPMSYGSRLLACLSSNSALAYGFQIILQFEGAGVGLQWSNFFKAATVDDRLSVGTTFLFIIAESIVYLLIALYVERVKPGSFGMPEKWYFPFTTKFWFGSKYIGVEYDQPDTSISHNDALNIEAEPCDRRPGIRMINLRKLYSNDKVAVKDLTLNVFDNQITVLLGHNGAGKTTTMSILTGLLPPTSGTAIIDGYDIRQNLHKARSSIGLCPQHNILFDELTVREHLEFYASLKGLNSADVAEEVKKYVELLELEPKIDAPSVSLSGGMQRKLSVAIALCGRSKIVLCDEPTSGMDPAARRTLWNLLQREKHGRTILLTTHFMDEADILGDRIAIMSDGELKCCGSSFYLKKRFGTCYRLVCVKKNGCKTEDVTNVLRDFIPTIQVQQDIAKELSYALPDEYVDRFHSLFRELETTQQSLNIVSFGVSLTTLEEVFLKIGSDSNLNLRSSKVEVKQQHEVKVTDEATTNYSDVIPVLNGFPLRLNQCRAMFKKRYFVWSRNWVLYLLQIIILAILIVASVAVVRTSTAGDPIVLNDLKLSLDRYDETVTLLQMPKSFDNLQLKSIFNEYQKLIQSHGSEHRVDVFREDIQTHFLKLAETSIWLMNREYLVGLSLNEHNTIIAWFNNQPFHTLPVAIDLVHNSMIKSKLGPEYSIHVSNHPIPYTVELSAYLAQTCTGLGFQLALNIPFAMAFVASFYIIFYVKERVSKAKLLQFVSGLNVWIFWTTSFLFDFATYVLSVLILILTLWAFQETGWNSSNELAPLFVALVLFGFAVLPLIYLASLFFEVPTNGFVIMAMTFLVSGITPFLVVLVLSMPSLKQEDEAERINQFFRIFPHYLLSNSLFNINKHNTIDRLCQQSCQSLCSREFICAINPLCCETSKYAYEEPGIGRNLMSMAVIGTVCTLILLTLDCRIFESVVYYIRSFRHRNFPPSQCGIDKDVAEEKARIEDMTAADLQASNLILRNLSKFYGNFLAVNQVSIGIEGAECFGLLGVNGAGKTSTFRMLTGDLNISRGEAYVRGISLKSHMSQVHKVIGYCPQFDAFIEELTGAETLELFALLRGIHPNDISSLSERLSSDLNFKKHLNKRVNFYSGGNRRKLSTAIALTGNPIVVYLDEPTTGMDPGSKRNLWNTISKVRSSGKSIILTSHSMEECEALCTRLAIMVNGEFKCLGSSQHLKSKFPEGFTLTINVQKNESEYDTQTENAQVPDQFVLRKMRIKEYVQSHFYGACLDDECHSLITFFVPPSDTLKWSSMFGLMEQAKQTLHIEDYSIGQTSLEKVFLSFTGIQRDEFTNSRRRHDASERKLK